MCRNCIVVSLLCLMAVLAMSIASMPGCRKESPAPPRTSTPAGNPGERILVENRIVEASCGLCNFDMKADDCTLAVRIDGTPYWVDGVSIDDLGDAHADDGLCAVIRQAKVTGWIENGRFHATSIELLAAAE